MPITQDRMISLASAANDYRELYLEATRIAKNCLENLLSSPASRPLEEKYNQAIEVLHIIHGLTESVESVRSLTEEYTRFRLTGKRNNRAKDYMRRKRMLMNDTDLDRNYVNSRRMGVADIALSAQEITARVQREGRNMSQDELGIEHNKYTDRIFWNAVSIGWACVNPTTGEFIWLAQQVEIPPEVSASAESAVDVNVYIIGQTGIGQPIEPALSESIQLGNIQHGNIQQEPSGQEPSTQEPSTETNLVRIHDKPLESRLSESSSTSFAQAPDPTRVKPAAHLVLEDGAQVTIEGIPDHDSVLREGGDILA